MQLLTVDCIFLLISLPVMLHRARVYTQVVQVTSLVKYSNSVVDVLSCFTKVCVTFYAVVILLVTLPFVSVGFIYHFDAFVSHFYVVGRLLLVDLIKPVSNIRPPVRPSVCPSTKVFSISMKFRMLVEVDE